LDWQQNGLVRPQCVLNTTREYLENQDQFGLWLKEYCKCGSNCWASSESLFKSWTTFSFKNGEQPGDIRQFGPKLKKAGFTALTRNNQRGWSGVRLLQREYPNT